MNWKSGIGFVLLFGGESLLWIKGLPYFVNKLGQSAGVSATIAGTVIILAIVSWIMSAIGVDSE